VAQNRTNEALERLNRGIQESQQMVQQQTMKLAQDFFSDSTEELKQQIKDNRTTLEKLPGQIPGGQEESFQLLFQELMDNYAAVEQALKEAQQNVTNLDTESLVKQGEIEATDAARREARELDVDLTQVEGTGSEGRITVDDVKKFAEEQEAPKASEAAQRRAEEMGVDLSQIEGTGSGGLITVKDVTSMAGEAQEQATDTAQQAAGQAQEAADGAAGQAADATDGSGEPKATNAARRKAEELGIDLSQIQGSGAGGLITIRDVVRS
jgi:pyruvate/2-oxoglutarate dehydrogenase complex dihydrolipoamide acyltransferase (E2) component